MLGKRKQSLTPSSSDSGSSHDDIAFQDIVEKRQKRQRRRGITSEVIP